jgi:HEAT repeat protein
LATATSLAQLGIESGGDALERLSHDSDATVRRLAAEAMGIAGEARFAGTLVRLLGDQLNVKRAALASLQTVAGKDIGQGDDAEPPAMGEQIRRWRQWHYQNQARGHGTTPKATSASGPRNEK